MVSREGLEPSTPGLKGPCSNQLSYRPRNVKYRVSVGVRPNVSYYITLLAFCEDCTAKINIFCFLSPESF